MSEIKQIFFQFLILLFCLDSSLGQKCGFSDKSTRIYGGKYATFQKWPWMVHINTAFEKPGNFENKLCGGTLLNEEWVLTAAHCFYGTDSQTKLIAVDVRLGNNDITKSPRSEFKTTSAQNIIHESYNQRNLDNDIALIKLKTKVELKGKHRYLQPICLPPKGITVDKNRCFVTGWGITSRGETSDILQELKLPIIDNEKCNAHGKFIFKSDKQLCAGSRGQTTCQGDSGGPLQCQLANDVWVQEGITSYGGLECARGKHAVYTRVSAYVPWIKSKTGIK